MWELLTGPTMIRMVVYSTISYMLSCLGIIWDDSRFWCFIVLIYVLEHLASSQGRQEAIEYLMELSKMKILRLKEIYDSTDNSIDEIKEVHKLMKKDDKDGDE